MKPIKKQRNPKQMLQANRTLTGTYNVADDSPRNSKSDRRKKIDGPRSEMADELVSRSSRYSQGK